MALRWDGCLAEFWRRGKGGHVVSTFSFIGRDGGPCVRVIAGGHWAVSL